ncbi:uncharacterized protein LOC111086202 isoform X2 [Limulus polyphemus]|uniref:Uncharacterized protein LOC111086202 isoform X2 n=1 Tax=Limulus polyphemus TaxID=6850 RepID=A0ABM1SJI1_LIMPO|nr:uncharacterized protein LOC111086202 isoform X2 [Limulus polyphemus]
MTIDPSRVVPRVVMAVLVGIAFILLVQFELRHRKNQKGKQLLWSEKHFSPNKWWMSRNEELWNFTSLVRQRSKSLVTESQSTVTDDSVVPLLSSDASICTVQPTNTPSLLSTGSLSVNTTCSQTTVSSSVSTASSSIKSSMPIHNFLFVKSPVLNNESYFVKPPGRTISTPLVKSSPLTVASEFVRSTERVVRPHLIETTQKAGPGSTIKDGL